MNSNTKSYYKKLMIFCITFIMLFNFNIFGNSTTKAQENLFEITASTTEQEILNAINDTNNNGMVFTEDANFELTKTLEIKRDFKIKVNDGVNVTFSTQNNKLVAFKSFYHNLKFEILGKIEFSNFNRAIYTRTNANKNVEFIGSGIAGKDHLVFNVNQSAIYNESVAGNLSFTNISIRGENKVSSKEAIIFSGDSESTLNVSNSNFHLTQNGNNDVQGTLIFSGRKADFTDSTLIGYSRGHYNLNFHDGRSNKNNDEPQVVNFNTTVVEAYTKADANPVSTRFGFSFPRTSVGLQTSNTDYNFNNSSYKFTDLRDNPSNTQKGIGYEMDNSSLVLNASTFIPFRVGFDTKGPRATDSNNISLFDNSVLKVDRFDSNNRFADVNVHGGSVNIPVHANNQASLPNNKKVKNSSGDLLTHCKV